MTVLVTGFEPFGAWQINSSEKLVEALGVKCAPNLVTAVLPTSYRRSESALLNLLETHRPRLTLLLGLSERATKLTLEQVALNLDDSSSVDNDGEVRVRQRILSDAPVAYFATMDLERMARVAETQGEAVAFSRDAGGFICNHAFFAAAHHIATHDPARRCGFVHMPPSPDDERMRRFVDVVRSWTTLE